MPLMPKRVKFRKTQRGSRAGNAQRGTEVSFGDFGLQSLGRGWITNRQIEACRISVNRYLKRKGKVWIRIFPHKSITGRPPETRMGKGKGAVEAWVAVVRPGTMLFEIAGVPESDAREALRLASNKLGIRTRFIVRNSHA
ncbi:50S ribosomal protein L16 [Persicirhabdus sediminis]|uniref:Large ribosomal subunit protein uL16 n=1 Tax=Persicirhabdus sediminis TaxID=454144 RepID=A0A8J7MGM0_9BACT|nr:50S ribosomal protein L16 [Persicirhabdus sediminis]MBK1792687.1 50S ribosomal protein L16 [Persicirhabdus sediminis]